jgi:integrase
LLSAIFEHARKEWKWITHNPAKEIKRPSNPRPRDRRISLGEQMQMLKALKFELGQIPTRVSHHLATAFLFARETAMRKGEILSLTWDDVFLSKRYVRLLDSKNGDGRHIPLSKTAVALLEQQPRHDPQKRCFPIPLNSSDALWRKARQRAQITDLHFHDTRHEAITRLAKKLDVLELARMVGHRDVRSLMIYYNATATELAERLD